jgi:hypothetical protein
MKKIQNSTQNISNTHKIKRKLPNFGIILVAAFMIVTMSVTALATGVLTPTLIVSSQEEQNKERAELEEIERKISSGEIIPDDLSWDEDAIPKVPIRSDWETLVAEAEARTSEPVAINITDPDYVALPYFGKAPKDVDILVEGLFRGANLPTSITSLPYYASGNFKEYVYTNYKFLPSSINKIKVVLNGTNSSGSCNLKMYLIDCNTGIQYGPHDYGTHTNWSEIVTWTNLDVTHYWAAKFVKTVPSSTVSFAAEFKYN